MKLLSLFSLCLAGCSALGVIYEGFYYTGPKELETVRIINGTVFNANDENYYLENVGRFIIHNETDGSTYYDFTELAQAENLDSDETAFNTYLIRIAAGTIGGLITAKPWPPRGTDSETEDQK
ncbi:putative secreted protein [Wickerhamomyces ciferrii]|uniref:Secreted protein n=1 Tax=Wickerhamomyces ciferrii (strain ATCC 14091 / BCRC 22168 / CBS 111 / JCM 3599 / NBRC 0793 / NRRL Y-1031 F-60-10) TaxID=1206466 RepID=K0KW83_WICCF|nr:uncharacterized protein BN7_5823 [Wickerhamomyces ciferrii]CCH46232.1 putative secreted protein [Wickerhamomyces ciferrii]